jgi:mannose-6-phosphate isomerase-like protein (cupin superfamily)
MPDDSVIQAPKGVRPLTGPTLIRYAEATRFLWGDEESHQVADWIYGGGSQNSSFMYSLRPGEYFKHSKTWKPLYDQHRFYYVYQGSLAIHDPVSGEVAVAEQGEAIYWRGNKWHFGYNFGAQETLVLDVWAPAGFPLDVAEVEVSRQKPDLAQVVNGRYELLGRWPAARPQVEEQAWREGGLVTIRRADCLPLIVGEHNPMLVSLFISTDEISAGAVELLPAASSDSEAHPGDEALFVMAGRLNLYLPDRYEWFEVHPKDSLYIPQGVRHQYFNMSDAPVEFFFTVAPKYR